MGKHGPWGGGYKTEAGSSFRETEVPGPETWHPILAKTSTVSTEPRGRQVLSVVLCRLNISAENSHHFADWLQKPGGMASLTESPGAAVVAGTSGPNGPGWEYSVCVSFWLWLLGAVS